MRVQSCNDCVCESLFCVLTLVRALRWRGSQKNLLLAALARIGTARTFSQPRPLRSSKRCLASRRRSPPQRPRKPKAQKSPSKAKRWTGVSHALPRPSSNRARQEQAQARCRAGRARSAATLATARARRTRRRRSTSTANTPSASTCRHWNAGLFAVPCVCLSLSPCLGLSCMFLLSFFRAVYPKLCQNSWLYCAWPGPWQVLQMPRGPERADRGRRGEGLAQAQRVR